MKLTEDQIVTINEAGMGCSIIKTGCTPDAAEDKTLPTNAYLLELKKDGETWFDLVMGESVGIFDTYYDMFGDVMQKMSYTRAHDNHLPLTIPYLHLNQDLRKRNDR